MAASFKVGQEVKLVVVVPQGPVAALSVDPEGNIQYLVSYKDVNGVDQSRWFSEHELTQV